MYQPRGGGGGVAQFGGLYGFFLYIFGGFWFIFGAILGGFMVQFRGFQVHMWGFSGHFVLFWSDVFLEFFSYPPGASGVWEPRQGVRCILRTMVHECCTLHSVNK